MAFSPDLVLEISASPNVRGAVDKQELGSAYVTLDAVFPPCAAHLHGDCALACMNRVGVSETRVNTLCAQLASMSSLRVETKVQTWLRNARGR